MKRRLRYGMVGGFPGAFIGGLHRAAIRLNDNADLVCGCFSNVPEEQAQAVAAYGIAADRDYKTYQEMAETESKREDRIDWVDIVTPNFLHYPVAKLFLEKGFNVVCEKPLCFTVAEGLELKRIAKENGCLFCVTYTYTGHAMTREAKQIVQSGLIGKVHMVMGEYPQDGLLCFLKAAAGQGLTNWRFDPVKSGRGATVADIGTHIDSWVSYVTGLKITEVCCNLEKFEDGPPLDNNVMCIIKYDNGANGMYWASQVAVGYDNALRIRIMGDNGTLEFVQENGNYLKLMLLNEPVKIYSRGRPYMTPEGSKQCRLPAGHAEGITEAFANIYKDFSTALYDQLDKKVCAEESYGYPTIDMGIEGTEFFNKCIDSYEDNCTWKKLEY